MLNASLIDDDFAYLFVEASDTKRNQSVLRQWRIGGRYNCNLLFEMNVLHQSHNRSLSAKESTSFSKFKMDFKLNRKLLLKA